MVNVLAGNYRPDTCAYCGADTWCETRGDGSPQCRACKVERFFERVLYRPLGYVLLPWQRKILRDLYGTLGSDAGQRRYRQAYISVAKKQGKSFLCGGLPIYHLLLENEENPEAYGAAAAKDQAGIVFKAALQLVKNNPLLLGRLRILESTKRILRRDGGGGYTVLSADGDVQDGIEPSLAIIDELHRWKTKKAETLFDVITKGTISRREPLVVEITTAGEEHECPLWFSEHEYARHILDGSLKSDSFYAAIWAADAKRIESDPDYWKSREARVAANPSHEDNGGFLKDERLVTEMERAIAKPEKYHAYLRYHLNVPIAEGESPVIQMPVWCQGGGGEDLRTWPTYDVELLISKWNLAGRSCIAGLDLAWTTDMAAVSFVFPPMESDSPAAEQPTGAEPKGWTQSQWKVLLFFWLPKDRIDDIARRTKAPLVDWIRRGFLATSEGAEISVADVFDKIKWGARMFDVQEVCVDRWGGAKSAAELLLVPEGFTCVLIPQTMGGLTEATKKLLGLYMNSQLAHGNNPILNWHASCMALQTDGGDNCKPVKPPRDISAKRIDGIAATVTALARAMLIGSNTISYTGLRSVG